MITAHSSTNAAPIPMPDQALRDNNGCEGLGRSKGVTATCAMIRWVRSTAGLEWPAALKRWRSSSSVPFICEEVLVQFVPKGGLHDAHQLLTGTIQTHFHI